MSVFIHICTFTDKFKDWHVLYRGAKYLHSEPAPIFILYKFSHSIPVIIENHIFVAAKLMSIAADI